MELRPLLALTLTGTLAGCGPAISSARFTQAPPRPPDHEIRLYATKLPMCAYQEIGIVLGKERAFTSLDDVIAAMRERALELGGDAIVGLGQTQNVAGGTIIDNTVSIESRDGLAGTVIRFTDEACTS